MTSRLETGIMAALLKRGSHIFLIGLSALVLAGPLSALADVKAPAKGVGAGDRKPPDKNENMEYREEERIPLPIAIEGKVLRGRTITFLLETVEDLDAQEIHYSARSLPKFGTLSDIRVLPNRLSAAEVDYTPDANQDVPLDSFTFSARYPRGRTSAPMEVKIEVATPQPVLQLPPNVNFGAVLVGQSETVTIPIKNIGNDFFEGPLKMFEEGARWSWVPDPDQTKVRLEPEEQIMATFRFSPVAPGPRTTHASLTPGFDGAIAMVTAEGVIPFAVDHSKVELKFDLATRKRTGTVKVNPRSRDRFDLTFGMDERLNLPRGELVVLNPGRGQEIKIELPAGDPMPFEGVLTIQTDGFKREIQVKAKPSPARLAVELSNTVSAILDFGSLYPEEEKSGEFGIRNEGGVPEKVAFALPAPFELEEVGEEFEIAPNSVREFRIWFRPEARGAFRETIQLSPTNELLLVKLRGDCSAVITQVREPDLVPPGGESGLSGSLTRPSNSVGNGTSATSPRVGPQPNSNPQSSGPAGAGYSNLFANQGQAPTLDQLKSRQSLVDSIPSSVVGIAGRIPLPPMITRDRLLAYSPFKTRTDTNLPKIEKFGLREAKTDSLELIWPRAGNHENYEVEARITKFNPKNKRYECIWFPLQEAEYKLEEELVIAELTGLQPDTYYMFRVFSKGPDNTNSLPSVEFGMSTLAPPSRAGMAGILAIGGVVISVLSGFFIYMRRSGLI